MPPLAWPLAPSPWPLLFWPLFLLALVQSLLLTLHAWEHRRFVRSRLRKPCQPAVTRRVLLIAPCKGLEPGLEDNLRPLLRQDHGNYEVAFVVESEHDAACAAIRRLIEQNSTPARLIVAGRSREHGQKVHNLLAATAGLPPRIEVLAFVDSDARPSRDWLRTLTARLDDKQVGATTAYRVMLPTRPHPAAFLLASLNSAVAGLLGPGGRHLVWGGSWAIRRDVFETIALRQAWQGTLSDDLVASRTLQRAKLRIEFEPGCMAASPIDAGWPQAVEFLRRQFTISRCYVPRWWLSALAAVTLAAAAFWGSIAGAIAAAVRGESIAVTYALSALALYSLGVFRAELRQQAARLYRPDLTAQLRGVHRFELFAGPLVQLAALAALVSAMFSRRINWRGNRYYIGRAGKIRLLNAPPAGQPLAPPHFADLHKPVRK